jgi:hypothetical protein
LFIFDLTTMKTGEGLHSKTKIMEHLSHLNWLAIGVSAVAYFVLGSLWFGLLFGKKWMSLARVNPEDGKGKMGMLMGSAVLGAIIGSFGMAVLISILGIVSVAAAVKLSLLIGGCFIFAPMGVNFMFENRPVALLIIDAGYPTVGIMVCSIILSMWH